MLQHFLFSLFYFSAFLKVPSNFQGIFLKKIKSIRTEISVSQLHCNCIPSSRKALNISLKVTFSSIYQAD